MVRRYIHLAEQPRHDERLSRIVSLANIARRGTMGVDHPMECGHHA